MEHLFTNHHPISLSEQDLGKSWSRYVYVKNFLRLLVTFTVIAPCRYIWRAVSEKIITFLRIIFFFLMQHHLLFVDIRYFFVLHQLSFCWHEILFRATSTRFCRGQVTFCATSNFLFQHKIIFRATPNFCSGHV